MQPEPEDISDNEADDGARVPGRGYSVWTGEPMLHEPSPPPHAQWSSHSPACWQVWGGKRTGWITYSAEVQELLNAAWHRGETVSVTIAKCPYKINGREGWQDRQDTDAPVRKVRWATDAEIRV